MGNFHIPKSVLTSKNGRKALKKTKFVFVFSMATYLPMFIILCVISTINTGFGMLLAMVIILSAPAFTKHILIPELEEKFPR